MKEGGNRADWEALRAEYVAGGVSQKALAERHGVSYAALCRRAAVEGWAKARKQARGAGERENGRAAQAAGDEAGDTELLARLRHKLLKRMDHIADAIRTWPFSRMSSCTTKHGWRPIPASSRPRTTKGSSCSS